MELDEAETGASILRLDDRDGGNVGVHARNTLVSLGGDSGGEWLLATIG
jgi:hypothetical protein